MAEDDREEDQQVRQDLYPRKLAGVQARQVRGAHAIKQALD
jgi:hypothetical protein